MGNSTTMSYNGYELKPVPFMTLNKQYNNASDGTPLGTTFQAQLQGTATPRPTGDGGIFNVVRIQDDLREAFATNGAHFLVKCDDTILFDTYPRVLSINFSPTNNNWVDTSSYTIELEFDEEPEGSGFDNPSLMPPYIQSANENWNVEFSEDRNFHTWSLNDDIEDDVSPYVLRLTHNISAVGKTHYTAEGLPRKSWEQAREYVVPRLGFNPDRLLASGVLNVDLSLLGLFNHVRTNSINELGGEYSVTESWLVMSTGISGVPGDATEDYTINVRKGIDTGLTSISVDGSIQGLETRDFGVASGDFDITTTKYDAALDYFNVVKDRLYFRAKEAGASSTSRNINPLTLETSVGHNPPQGTISYTYAYDDRPCNFISNAIHEVINIVDNNPHDIIASLAVLGRAQGPILQDLGTVSVSTREVNIEAVIVPSSGCELGSDDFSNRLIAAPTGDVNSLLCDIESNLTGAYDQVFKTNDNQSWNISTGRYSRNISWTYANCEGDAPATSFCPEVV